jgi:beta-lactamase class D
LKCLLNPVRQTAQCIAVVWVQNVLNVSNSENKFNTKLNMVQYANPDVARMLVAKAWWQVSMPLMVSETISVQEGDLKIL